MRYKLYRLYKDYVSLMPVMGGTDSMIYHNEHEKMYHITLDELFEYLIAKVKVKNTVTKLRFFDGELTISLDEFVNGEYRHSETTIEIARSLTKDKVFMGQLNSLLDTYDELKMETNEEIASLRKKYSFLIERTQRIEGSVYDAVYDYAETDSILDYDEQSLSEIYHYLVDNRKSVARDTDFYNKHLSGRLANFSQSCYECPILSMIVGCVPFFCALGFSFSKLIVVLTGILAFVPMVNYCAGISGYVDFNNYRQRLHTINKLMEELEKRYGFSKESTNSIQCLENRIDKKEDKLYEFIRRDLFYIKTHINLDLKDIFAELNVLIDEYVRTLSSGEELASEDKKHFLDWLTELEIKMYGRNPNTGFIEQSQVSLNNCDLEARLDYLGYRPSKDLVVRFLDDVRESIKDVYRMPYEGCEVELLQMFTLAQDYARLSIGENIDYEKVGNRVGQLAGKLEEIEKTVREKRNSIMGDGVPQSFDNRLDSQLEAGKQISLLPLE